MDKFDILRDIYGHAAFRPGQEALIDALAGGRDALAVMPTGAGKSICYQVPALLADGLTLVISPLISLMKDQVGALVQAGVRAAYLNSAMSAGQMEEVYRRAAGGAYKILYIAPERLETGRLAALGERVSIPMVMVDEAHCISQWGQDFRPSYLKIADFIGRLPVRPVIGAFTATATRQVKADIVDSLGLRDPFIAATGFDRPNLHFSVLRPRRKDDTLLALLRERSRAEKSGIIYCGTRKAVEAVCGLLREQGYGATRYHAGLEDGERQANQDDFLYDRQPIMVATNAFGMGIDKSNVAFVIHYNMPKNLESYYQEAGRAGRDGGGAECILLYSGQDVRLAQFLIENSEERADAAELPEAVRAELKQKEYDQLRKMTVYCTTADCLRGYILRYFGEAASPHCGNCGNCRGEFEETDVTVQAQKVLSCIYRLNQKGRFGVGAVVDCLRGNNNEKTRLWHMENLPTYGIMADTPPHRIRSILEYLMETGRLRQTDGEFPTLEMTASSVAVLKGQEAVTMKIPRKARTSEAGSQASTGPADSELLERLKALRRQLAGAAGVPAYVVFSDAALQDMCVRMPETEAEFLEVSGVGKAKLERYGTAFTACITAYVREKATK